MGRWGGDEFLVIFPGTDQESAVAVAERLRKLIENTRFVYHKQEISLTVSVGVTEIQGSDTSQEMVFNRVDKAMYQAKKKGRNMVALI
jgi:diguanylate cyclase (GGDEF)-like protein